MPSRPPKVIYAFDRWEIDLGRRELRFDRRAVPVGARAFEIMEVLLHSAGALVSKNDLIQRIWPGAAVGENTLQVHISALRKALRHDRALLVNASGRGYRLAGSWVARPSVGEAGISTEEEPPPHQTRPPASPILVYPPRHVSELIGRAAEQRRLGDLLSASRLVTITGAGGIGKSRLALEVIRSREVNAAIHQVELSSLVDPEQVPPAIADGLGLPLAQFKAGSTDPANGIGPAQLLLVLDNCEHVIGVVVKMVEIIIARCPGVTILAISQEMLRVQGEVVFPLLALDLPPERETRQDEILRSSAVQLFLRRMQEQRSDFTPLDDDLVTIAAICRRLDALPLAIELAAAQAATLGPAQVLQHLDDRFEMLVRGRRTAAPRHRTLRAAFDWSFNLLNEPERHLLCRLAIYPGSITCDGALAVTGKVGRDPAETMQGLASLAAKSLLTQSDPGGAVQWRMLETTRVYARMKLAEMRELSITARRHAEYIHSLMTASGPNKQVLPTVVDPRGGAQQIDNIRAALNWAFSDEGDAMLGVSLTAATIPVWLHLSLVSECRYRVEQALSHLAAQTGLDPRRQIQLHIALGSALLDMGWVAAKVSDGLQLALDSATTLADVPSQLRALWALWNHRFNVGEHRAALPLAEQFLRVACGTGDPADVLVGHGIVGVTRHYAGDQQEAAQNLTRVLDDYVMHGDQRHRARFVYDQRLVARAMLSRVLCVQGFLGRAQALVQSCVDEALLNEDRLSLRYVLAWAACPVALLTKDVAAADRYVSMLVDLVSGSGGTFWQIVTQAQQAAALIGRGDFALGSARLADALDTFARAGFPSMRYETDYVGALVDGMAGAGDLSGALLTAEQALARCDRDGVMWSVPELRRMQGELLMLQGGEKIVEQAEASIQAALAEARRQGALLWMLRAACSLVRLHQTQRTGREDAACVVLGQITNLFTEGSETPDLLAAHALLTRSAEG